MLELTTTTATRRDVRALVHDRGWATIVTGVAPPVISHLPIVLFYPGSDAGPDDLTVLGHLARTDAEQHELGEHPVALVVEGPDGYVSPTWYGAGPYVPTWNFVVAHLHGVPEILDAEETYDVLTRTVDRFESERPEPFRLDTVEDYARSIAPHVTGFRLRPTRVVGKAKLSQDKSPEIVSRVIEALESDDVHANAALAAAMRQHHLGSAPKAGR